jgi:hypothetical protein
MSGALLGIKTASWHDRATVTFRLLAVVFGKMPESDFDQ